MGGGRRMRRRECFATTGIVLAFLLCAMNLSILMAPSSSGDGGNDDAGMEVSAGRPKDESNGKSGNDGNRLMGIINSNQHAAHNASVEEELYPSLWSEESCRRLVAHENGHWHHRTHYSEGVNNSSFLNDRSIREMYFPEELKWLGGQNSPREGFGKCRRIQRHAMYTSIIGHQCGCGVRGFEPSHSVWVPRNETEDDAASVRAPVAEEILPDNDRGGSFAAIVSPTLRLAERLANANATLCFAGDSLDYQIYMAMHHNLRRMDELHRLRRPGGPRLVQVVTREIPVTRRYHTAPGNVDDWFLKGRRPPDELAGSFVNARGPPRGGRGSMSEILETKAIIVETKKLARIRYFMTYGWSPWNVDFMEDCNVIIMNLGVHYNPEGDHMGKETRHTLMDDMLAAITYLTNFTASADNRIAVWRSALPQHFSTNDGHFHGWDKLGKDHSCSANDDDDVNFPKEQAYNKAYDDAFSSLECQPERDETTRQPCGHLRRRCTVDPAADVGYQTLYNFWRDNNCTDHIERERSRLDNLSRTQGGHQSNVTGTIFRWRIFDLFDIPTMHSSDMDCSHMCYVPPLWEAAFERLLLLLSPSLSSF